MPTIESAPKLWFQGTFSAATRLASALIAAAIVTAPRISTACAVCFSGRDDATQLAFRVSTGLMTLMPFLLVGGLLLWLRKRFREIAEQERVQGLKAADRVAADPAISQPPIR